MGESTNCMKYLEMINRRCRKFMQIPTSMLDTQRTPDLFDWSSCRCWCSIWLYPKNCTLLFAQELPVVFFFKVNTKICLEFSAIHDGLCWTFYQLVLPTIKPLQILSNCYDPKCKNCLRLIVKTFRLIFRTCPLKHQPGFLRKHSQEQTPGNSLWPFFGWLSDPFKGCWWPPNLFVLDPIFYWVIPPACDAPRLHPRVASDFLAQSQGFSPIALHRDYFRVVTFYDTRND